MKTISSHRTERKFCGKSAEKCVDIEKVNEFTDEQTSENEMEEKIRASMSESESECNKSKRKKTNRRTYCS